MIYIFKIKRQPADQAFEIPDDARIISIETCDSCALDWFEIKYMVPVPSSSNPKSTESTEYEVEGLDYSAVHDPRSSASKAIEK